jgi:hypothetical protein
MSIELKYLRVIKRELQSACGKNHRARNFPDDNRWCIHYFAYHEITSCGFVCIEKRINKFVSDRRHWFATKYVFLWWWLLITQAIGWIGEMRDRTERSMVKNRARQSIRPTRWEESRRLLLSVSLALNEQKMHFSIYLSHTTPSRTQPRRRATPWVLDSYVCDHYRGSTFYLTFDSNFGKFVEFIKSFFLNEKDIQVSCYFVALSH